MTYVLSDRFGEQSILTKDVKTLSWKQDKPWTYKQDNYKVLRKDQNDISVV